MKLTVISPVPGLSGGDLAEIKTYLQPHLAPGTALEVCCLDSGFPSVESELHGVVNGARVVPAAKKAQEDGADGILVNCFDDPGVYACRESLAIPVFGCYQPALLTALGLAERVAVLTTDVPGILSEERKARLMGIDSRLAAVLPVDLGVLELEGSQVLLARLTQACRTLWESHRVGCAVLGCTCMHHTIGPLRAALREQGCPIAVVEPLVVSAKYLELVASLGQTNSLHLGLGLEALGL